MTAVLSLLLFFAACSAEAGRGETCGDVGHGTVYCADDLECVQVPGTGEFACAAPGDPGSSCEADADCNDMLLCIGEICQDTRSEDETCQADRQCEGELVCVHTEFISKCDEDAGENEDCAQVPAGPRRCRLQ